MAQTSSTSTDKTVGRPLKFEDIDKLKAAISTYFKKCDDESRPYTITGLALALDTSRETLLNYEARPEFFDTIKAAKEKCENYVEEYLFNGKNVAGGIFNLVNNYGWQNRQNTDITSGGKPVPLLGGVSHVPNNDSN